MDITVNLIFFKNTNNYFLPFKLILFEFTVFVFG